MKLNNKISRGDPLDKHNYFDQTESLSYYKEHNNEKSDLVLAHNMLL